MEFLFFLTFTSQALAGEVGMSDELDDLAKSLYNGSLPAIWRRLAPATLKSLGNWITHFQQRLAQYLRWVMAHFLVINVAIYVTQ